MTEDQAQISSLVSTIEDLTRRVVELADRHKGTSRDDAANDFYEVERALKEAVRKLQKAAKALA